MVAPSPDNKSPYALLRDLNPYLPLSRLHQDHFAKMAVSADTIQTIIILYVFTWLAMGLMVARLVLRRYRGQTWDPSDYITMICMACLLARMSFVHVVLVWGSNNVTAAYRQKHVFGQREIYERTVGSKLTLVNRVFYNT